MIRSGYSFKAAYGPLPDIVARVKAVGDTDIVIADRLSTFAFTRITKLAKEADLRVIYGVEIAVTPELGVKKPPVDFWKFLAIDSLRPLHDLIYLATSNPGKEPSLTYQQALAAPGLIKVAGERLLLAALPTTPLPDFYIGLSPATPLGLARAGAAAGLPFLATRDTYYPTAADLERYRIALGRRSGTQTYPRHILSLPNLYNWLKEAGHSEETVDAAFGNRRVAFLRCHAQPKRGALLKPERPATLRQMCERRAPELNVDLSDPIYQERLTRELNLLAEKGFEDYMYIVSDLMKYARANMICGPARGSSCGSLVCYLLDITTIDPIPYGLIFERFVDINRMDLPDIDMDFSDVNRHMVFTYLENKYGKGRVARLGTVGMFGGRSALTAAAVALHVPKWRTDKLVDSLIVRSSGDARVNQALEDSLSSTAAGMDLLKEYPEIAIAGVFEGQPSHSSQHAAGVILTDGDVLDYVAVDARSGAAQVDKKDAEELNLLKLDCLGLTQLSVFERTLQLADIPPVGGFLESIPLDDPAAFRIFNENKLSGIFQFEGTAVRSLAGQITFDDINDPITLSALCRPGPLATGGAQSWIRRKNGQEAVPPPLHPLLGEMTADTFGVVIYQEQTMRVTREIGQFSWADTSTIRKLMSGRMGNERFRAFWEKFKKGAMDNGLTESQAKEIWSSIETMGSWAFNKAHSVAYGMVSYQAAWLKAHYPIEYAAATLDANPDPTKQLAILRELDAEGVKFIPIHPELSTDRWTPATIDGERVLIGPLTNIKGIGPAKLTEILSARNSGQPLKPALAKSLSEARTDLDELFPIQAAIARLAPDLPTHKIFTPPTPLSKVKGGMGSGIVVLALVKSISPRQNNDEQNLLKRGGRRLSGPETYLNLWLKDDFIETYVKVDSYRYQAFGPQMLEQIKPGKSIIAIKGNVPPSADIIFAQQWKYIGDLE